MGVKQSMSLGLLWFLLSQGGLLLCVMAKIQFVVEEVNITRMCLEQPLLTVNGMFPGPNITVTRGDTIQVDVLNNGSYPITIHWHGVKQLRNPWSDGPENITQTPIAGNGGKFSYILVFSDEEGTLWWHAHSDWSRASVHGAIVVLPPKEKYPYSTRPYHNQTIILGSWYRQRNLMEEYEATLISGGDADPADSYTINGYPGELNASCDDTYTLVVERNRTYHLRIINAVMEEEMFFAISGHSFTVVGLDGGYLTPIPTNYMMITPGQTMDILLTTDQPLGRYYMGASAFVNATNSNPIDLPVTRAILEYLDYTDPQVQDDLVDQLLPIDIKNATYAEAFTNRIRGLTGNKDYPIRVPKGTTNKNFLITISVNSLPCRFTPNNCTGPNFNGTTESGMHSASLNNQRFVTKDVSILQAYRCNISNVYTEDFPATPPKPFDYNAIDTGTNESVPVVGTKVMTVNYGETVEIVFQGTNVGNAENHPMHVHGYNFYLVANGTGNFDPSNVDYNLENPAEANTFGVPKNGWLAVRFTATNPGVWFLHCHLERHATWGMAGVLIVKPTDNTDPKQRLLKPPPDYPPCPVLH